MTLPLPSPRFNHSQPSNQSHGTNGRARPFAYFEREGKEEEEIRELIKIAQILDDQNLLFQDDGMDRLGAECRRWVGRQSVHAEGGGRFRDKILCRVHAHPRPVFEVGLMIRA